MKIQDKMNNLLSYIKNILPIEDIKNAQDFINYQEYGIALELICVQLYEHDKTIDTYIQKLILELILEMKLNEELINDVRLLSPLDNTFD